MKWIPGVVCVVICSASAAVAQPKPGYDPTSTHVFPAGARRGTTVEVRVGAECLPPGARLHVDSPWVNATAELTDRAEDEGEAAPRRDPTETPITYPKQWRATFAVSADAPPQAVTWHLSSAQGGTAGRPFLIGDLPEWIERESNSRRERAERIRLPMVVNGQIYGERDVDWYRFPVQAGQTVSVNTWARRLGSRLDPVVELYDVSGAAIETEQLHVGSDPVLVARSRKDSEWLLRVANVTFRGDPACVYRIELRPHSFTRGVLPSAGPIGPGWEAQRLIVSGAGEWMLEPWTVPPQSQAGDVTVAIPDSNSVAIRVGPQSCVLETEPNETPQSSGPVLRPGAAIQGRLASADDRDVFRLQAAAGQWIELTCEAFPPGVPTLPVLVLTDTERRQLARSDHGFRGRCQLRWKAAEAGDYFVEVRDLRFGARGGPDYLYLLQSAATQPDFRLTAAVDQTSLTQGKQTDIEVVVERTGGADGPVQLAVDGLPEGVEVVGETVIPAGKDKAKLTLKAAESARCVSRLLTITGTLQPAEGQPAEGDATEGQPVEGAPLSRVVQFRHAGVDDEGVAVTGPRSQMRLTVRHQPVFRLFCSEAYLYAHRGSVFMYPMEVERMNGFDGPITLQIGDRQNRDLDGIQMWPVTIPPGETEVELPIYLPETMAINVQSQSQLYSQAWARFTDSHGDEQSVLVLSEKRNMLRTLPPVVKLKSTASQVSMGRDGEGTLLLVLDRTSNFPEQMEVRLLSAPDGIAMEPVRIATGETQAVARLRTTPEFNPVDTEPAAIVLRGEGRMADGTLVISETRVQLTPPPATTE